MRPYFFKRPTVAVDKRDAQYRAKQRDVSRVEHITRGRSFFLSILRLAGGLFGAREELAAWLRVSDTGLPIRIVKAARDKSLASAQAKRERRKERNLRWWMADKTWRRA